MSDLEILDDLFEDYTWDEPESVQKFQQIKAGKYIVKIETAKVSRTSTDTPIVAWRLRVQEDEYKDRLIFKDSFITANAVPFLKKELHLVNVRARPSELIAELEMDEETLRDESKLNVAIGVKLDITVKYVEDNTGTQRQRVYFNRQIDERVAEDPQSDSYDIPF